MVELFSPLSYRLNCVAELTFHFIITFIQGRCRQVNELCTLILYYKCMIQILISEIIETFSYLTKLGLFIQNLTWIDLVNKNKNQLE